MWKWEPRASLMLPVGKMTNISQKTKLREKCKKPHLIPDKTPPNSKWQTYTKGFSCMIVKNQSVFQLYHSSLFHNGNGGRENISSIQKGHLLHYCLFLVITSISFARRMNPSLSLFFVFIYAFSELFNVLFFLCFRSPKVLPKVFSLLLCDFLVLLSQF